jgi:hypothetical protein
VSRWTSTSPPSSPMEIFWRWNEALDRLGAEDRRLVTLIEMRFFAGMKAEETAEALSESVHLVRHDLRYAPLTQLDGWHAGAPISKAPLQSRLEELCNYDAAHRKSEASESLYPRGRDEADRVAGIQCDTRRSSG